MEKGTKFFKCGFHYISDQDDKNEEYYWWFLNLKSQIKILQQRFDKMGISLKINFENNLIKISHKDPANIKTLVQLHINSYLAYMLGFTKEIQEGGHYLRFDEHHYEFVASHNPKLFMDYYPKHKSDKMRLLFDQKASELYEKFSELLKEVYGKLRLEVDESEKDLEIQDCRDRMEKNVTLIKDFEQYHDQMWKIKGIVQEVNDDSMNMDTIIFGMGKMIVLEFGDYTGSLNISAFDRNAEILSELVKQGKEYYVYNTKDQSGVTVSINNNVYKIHLETVEKVSEIK